MTGPDRPGNSGSPSSPRNPCSRLSPSAPTTQTIGSACPSLVVTIGEPAPRKLPHHGVPRSGRSPAPIFKTVSSLSGVVAGQRAGAALAEGAAAGTAAEALATVAGAAKLLGVLGLAEVADHGGSLSGRRAVP